MEPNRMDGFIKAVKSRAKVLAYRYHIPYRDLVNDGMVTILEVSNKNKNFHDKTMYKAINNRFCSIERKEMNRKKRFNIKVCLDEIDEMEDDRTSDIYDGIDKRVSIEKICSKLGPTCHLIGMLVSRKVSKKEIMKLLGIGNRTLKVNLDLIKERING